MNGRKIKMEWGISIIDDELKLSTLYDHYKETIDYLKGDIVERNKTTLVIFLIFIAYFVLELRPTESVEAASAWLNNKIGMSFGINYNILIAAVLICLCGYIIRYFQLCLNIEKQYSYVHSLESKINKIFKEGLITREGYTYLEEYPLLSALIHRVYTFFLPIGVILAMIIKIYSMLKQGLNVFAGFNVIIGIMVITSTYLYLLFVYRYVPYVKKLNNITKKAFISLRLYKED